MKRFIIKTLLLGLSLIGLNLLVGQYLYTFESIDMAEAGVFFPKLRWEEYYRSKDSVEVVILGSSHAYRSYEPGVMGRVFSGDSANRLAGDSATQVAESPVFNHGSSAQSPVTSYYILEEVLRNHRPRLVILDVYFMVFTSDQLLDNGLINWNYMENAAPKWAFFREGFSRQEQIATLVFPSSAYRKYLKPKVKKLLGRPYLPPEKGSYREKGYVGYADTLATEILRNYNQFDRFETRISDFTDKNVSYLRRIAERCAALDIPLVFSVSSMPEISVQKIRNYREISDYFRQVADSLQVPYYDFNLNRLPGLKDEVHYYDDDHMNLAGAQYFSAKVAEKIKPLLAD